MNKEVKNVLFPGPMVLFRSVCRLSSYLVKAKLHPLVVCYGAFWDKF